MTILNIFSRGVREKYYSVEQRDVEMSNMMANFNSANGKRPKISLPNSTNSPGNNDELQLQLQEQQLQRRINPDPNDSGAASPMLANPDGKYMPSRDEVGALNMIG